MSKSKWLGIALIAVLLAAAGAWFVTSRDAASTGGAVSDAAIADAEARIIAYLKENVRPGEPVLVTELHNNVFTKPDERQALQRLYDKFFQIPAAAAEIYTKTGKLPTLDELSRRFDLQLPGEIDVLLRVMESDPRVPRFFERDQATGEFITVDVELIRSDERFGRPLRK